MTKKEKDRIVEIFLMMAWRSRPSIYFNKDKWGRLEEIIKSVPLEGSKEDAKAVLLAIYNAFLAGAGRGEIDMDWNYD